MKLYLLIFSLVLLIMLSECNPQGPRQRPRPKPRPRPRPTKTPATTAGTGTVTTTAATTTGRPTPPPTTPTQQFFQCLQNCPTTSEYNPVCGSNQMVYQNMGKFMCAQNCGSDVQKVRNGNCAGLF